VAGLVPFLVYLRTLAPTVFGLDSAELTTGAYVLGIVHSPGSPVYLLLGHIFTWLPIGDIGYRLNLMSACAMTITMVLIFHIIWEQTQNQLLALLSIWFLSFTYYVWIGSLAAELYALHGTFFAGLLWLALRWRKIGALWSLYTFAFCFGLGLGNHLSLLLLLPGFSILFLGGDIRKSLTFRKIFFILLAGFAGLSVYWYLPIRYTSDTPLNYAKLWGIDLTTIKGFWYMITGQMFKSLFFSVPISDLLGEILKYTHQLWSNFLGFGVFIGAIGLYSGFKYRPNFHFSLLMMFSCHLAFYLTYGAPDKAWMFLPTFLIWGIWVGRGVTTLHHWVGPQVGTIFVPAALAVVAITTLFFNFSYADVSGDWSARELGETIFKEIQFEAAYFGTWKEVPILEYLQIVEGQRPDVELFNLFFLQQDEGAELVQRLLREGRPVYATSTGFLDTDDLKWQFLDTCECFHVSLHDYDRLFNTD
jgi:hypothetical protein